MTRTFADTLKAAVATLREAGIDTPERDARRLLAHAAKLPPDRLTLHLSEPFDHEPSLESALAARVARQPVSQIVGHRQFWGRNFRVTPDVLDPRPETEELIVTALERPFGRVLDLGTGSGCILLTLMSERPGAEGLGTDISPEALDVARENANRLGVSVALAVSDWFEQVPGQFDLIVSNPPYIAAAEMQGLAPELNLWEPRKALTDEADGLDAYRAIAAGAKQHLAPGGRVIVEIGPLQGADVVALFDAAGFAKPSIRKDMDGRDRIVDVMLPKV